MGQLKGKVAWFNNVKGFGFIEVPDHSDVFCHYSALQQTGYKTLEDGEEVEFDIELGTSGKPQAVNVVRVEVQRTEEQEKTEPLTPNQHV
jgi:CspA family cold shock protein